MTIRSLFTEQRKPVLESLTILALLAGFLFWVITIQVDAQITEKVDLEPIRKDVTINKQDIHSVKEAIQEMKKDIREIRTTVEKNSRDTEWIRGYLESLSRSADQSKAQASTGLQREDLLRGTP